MGTFVDAALGFPTIVLSIPLVVVIGYWVLVLAGALDLDTDGDGEADDGPLGFLGTVGLGGAPVMLVLSLLVAVAWFASLAGGVLLDEAGTGRGVAAVLGVAVLAAALVAAWAVTALLVRPLRRLFVAAPGASRRDFVGSPCVIRTGRVDLDFGQAEVTAPDGSSAIVQVRQTGSDALGVGDAAMIYDYDAGGEFFWVVPLDAALGPDPSHDHPSHDHPSHDASHDPSRPQSKER